MLIYVVHHPRVNAERISEFYGDEWFEMTKDEKQDLIDAFIAEEFDYEDEDYEDYEEQY